MHKFKYRAPRYPIDLPVHLTLEGSTLHGRCLEISREGMRLELETPMPVNASGTVSLSYRHISMEVPVRVKYTGAHQEGLRFIFESEKQRDRMAEFVALLSEPAAPTGPVLVK